MSCFSDKCSICHHFRTRRVQELEQQNYRLGKLWGHHWIQSSMATLNCRNCELTKLFITESIWSHSAKSSLKEAALILTMSRHLGHDIIKDAHWKMKYGNEESYPVLLHLVSATEVAANMPVLALVSLGMLGLLISRASTNNMRMSP